MISAGFCLIDASEDLKPSLMSPMFPVSAGTIILRLMGKDSFSVNQALIDKFLSLPPELRQSLTWDRGMNRQNSD